ncbi:MAG: hypothetical protein AAF465_04830 [Pseudomonadota bacterium]
MKQLHELLELEDLTDIAAEAAARKHRVEELRVADQVPWEGVEESPDQTAFERRQSERRDDLRISWQIRVQRFLNNMVDHIVTKRWAQVALVGWTVLCIATIAFYLLFRIEAMDSSLEEFSELGIVETELIRRREAWSEEEMKELAETVESTDRRRVFVDYRGIANWLREKSAFAEQIDLDFSYTMDTGSASSIENMLEVPIQVVITAMDNSEEQTFLHFLEFMRYLASSPWYVEIVESTIESEGEGATKLTVMLRVWVHGKVPHDGKTL